MPSKRPRPSAGTRPASPSMEVNGAAFAGDLVVGVLDDDLVAEESCRARSGVGDQCLLLRQFQVEFLTQERRQADLDVLCFRFWSGEPEEVVIAISHVTQPPESRINRVFARHAPPLLTQRTHRGTVPTPARTHDQLVYLLVVRVGYPGSASGVFWDENFLDVPVQPVQINIGEDWGCDAPLWSAGQRFVPYPVFQVPGLEHVLQQPKEPAVMNVAR